MMKARDLLVPVTCLLLLGAKGCGSKHSPVQITVQAPTLDGGQPKIEASAVLAEKGTILTFKAPSNSPEGTTLEVRFLNEKGTAVAECKNQGILLKGSSPLRCHPTAEGDFTIIFTVIGPDGHRHQTPEPVKTYVRPCKGCSVP